MNASLEKARAELLRKLEQSRGIESMVALGYRLLENLFVVFDTSYRLFARTENTVTDDPLWNELAKLGTFSHDTVDFFRAELFIAEVAYTEVVSALKSKELKYDRINGKLFGSDGTQIGNICVVACYRPFRPGDSVLIEKVCAAISAELERSGALLRAEEDGRETAVRQLIDGTLHPNSQEFETVYALAQELKPNLYVAVVDISRYDHTLNHLRYFRDTLRNIQSEFHYFIHRDNVVVLLDTDRELDVRRDLPGLSEFFRASNLYAGVSSRVSDLFELHAGFRKAVHALNYGMGVFNDLRVFPYDDFKIDHLIGGLWDRLEGEDLTDSIVEAVEAYDRERGTEYLELLYQFLLYGLCAEKAAVQLGLTPDAMAAEVRMLAERFQIDWNNGNRVVGIFLALKVKRKQ